MHHCQPANISWHALNAVLGNTLFSKARGVCTPQSLQDVVLTFHLPGDIKEMANRVVHPVTNETMTIYDKIIEVIELQEVWL